VTAAQTTAAAKATISTPLARFALMKVTEPPAAMEFSAGHPSGLSSLDMDIMKLAAQYTALNGRDFLSGLAQREQRNPQFDFLKPTHMLFSYFTSLVDAYAKLLQPPAALLEHVKEMSSMLGGLEKSVGRWVWERAEEERKKREVKEADAERSAFQSIDWYDFSIVETIEFEDDELYEPAGMLPGGYARTAATDSSHDMDMDMDMEEEDMDEDEDAPGSSSLPPPPPPVTSSVAVDDDVIGEVEEEEEDMKVVTDYTPRTASLSKGEKKATMMVDPISGKSIAVDQMTEHMRVQLMDPRWRIEQQRFLDKQQETGFAEGSSIADSLKQFARQRGDICGSAEEEEARLLADEGKRKKRVEVGSVIISIVM
jgi:splicing factor 3A subunit 1